MFTKKNFKEQRIELGRLRTKFQYETKYLVEYLSFTSDLTEKKNQQLSDQIFSDSESDPEAEAILQQLFEKEKDALLSYYHNSGIVLVYTVFESVLSDLCNEVKEFTGAGFSNNCLSGGNLIGKSKLYLELVSELPFDLIQGEWARIGQFQNLRNIIVHQNSCFVGSQQSVDKQKHRVSNNFHAIKISEVYQRFYILDDALVVEFVDLIKRFISKVIDYLESVDFLIEHKESNVNLECVPF